MGCKREKVKGNGRVLSLTGGACLTDVYVTLVLKFEELENAEVCKPDEDEDFLRG